MDIKQLIDNPLLSLIGRFAPQAKPVIDFVRAHEAIILAGAPVVQAAVEEGSSAFEAVKAKAPKFAEAVTKLINMWPAQMADSHPDLGLENVARQLGGSPKLTHEEEMAWMQSKSPISEDSKSGSG